MKTVEWWRATSQHMWRTYFAIRRQVDDANVRDAPPDVSDADLRIYRVCDSIFRNRFSGSDQDILRMYFTSRWGDDLYTVEDYSLKHNIPVKVIWIVIRKASRYAMEDVGLLDRREEFDE